MSEIERDEALTKCKERVKAIDSRFILERLRSAKMSERDNLSVAKSRVELEIIALEEVLGIPEVDRFCNKFKSDMCPVSENRPSFFEGLTGKKYGEKDENLKDR